MHKPVHAITAVPFWLLWTILATCPALSKQNDSNDVAIRLLECDANEESLKVRYEISNDSNYDIWLLAGFNATGVDAELFLDKDGHTLLIRRRLDVPFAGGGEPVYARCVRLRSGQSRTESICLRLPVRARRCFGPDYSTTRDVTSANRVVVEIGYYDRNVPEVLSTIAAGTEEESSSQEGRDRYMHRLYFKGVVYWNKLLSENLRDRNEETLVPYTYQWLGREHVLRAVAENIVVPYIDKDYLDVWHDPLELPSCERIEIHIHPSMLDYFFPYPVQQGLLSPAERDHLRSTETIVLDSNSAVQSFVERLNGRSPSPIVICEHTRADVVCFQGDETVAMFPMYNDWSVVLNDTDPFLSIQGQMFPRQLSPEIYPLHLRVECARNLMDLGRWIDIYYRKETGTTYPAPNAWCSIISIYDETRVSGEDPTRDILQCPSAGEGKSHYAMNPECKADSPGDTVLLFETKAGWNQQGGPELFTFDNHDPKGGCALLNDGTVKFIRTEDELKQLRWKP